MLEMQHTRKSTVHHYHYFILFVQFQFIHVYFFKTIFNFLFFNAFIFNFQVILLFISVVFSIHFCLFLFCFQFISCCVFNSFLFRLDSFFLFSFFTLIVFCSSRGFQMIPIQHQNTIQIYRDVDIFAFGKNRLFLKVSSR